MACIIHPSGAINGWNSVLKYKLKPTLTSGAVGTSVNPLWLAKEMEGKFQSSVENNFFTCPCRVLETNLPASILLPWLGREAMPISYSNITAASYEKWPPLWQIAAWFVCPTLQCMFIQNWTVGFVPRLSHFITASVYNDRWLIQRTYRVWVLSQDWASKLPRADPQSQQMSTFKKPLSYLCYCSTKLSSLSASLMLYRFLLLPNISLLSHLSSFSSPSLSLSGCLYLSSHPPWCFSPSLQSMWLLRCLSICSPRQAQRAGATLWLLGQ